jgi:DNA-binding transcriptional regulator GbsR (MarR family)
MSEEISTDVQVATALGRLMAFWGFRRNLGRIWALLYLSPEPMSAQDLCTRLKLSTGSVSMALGELQQWGAVRKRPVEGERREHYEAEGDIWATVARVLEQREVREIEQVQQAIELAQRGVENERIEATSCGDEAAVQAADFRSERLGELLSLASSISELFLLVLGQDSADELLDEPGSGLVEHRERPRFPTIPRAPLED